MRAFGELAKNKSSESASLYFFVVRENDEKLEVVTKFQAKVNKDGDYAEQNKFANEQHPKQGDFIAVYISEDRADVTHHPLRIILNGTASHLKFWSLDGLNIGNKSVLGGVEGFIRQRSIQPKWESANETTELNIEVKAIGK